MSVFLNGRILYRGRSAQSFRNPGFLGIVSSENDAIYLSLRKGSNELLLALGELGGGVGLRRPPRGPLSGQARPASMYLEPMIGPQLLPLL